MRLQPAAEKAGLHVRRLTAVFDAPLAGGMTVEGERQVGAPQAAEAAAGRGGSAARSPATLFDPNDALRQE